MGDIAQRAFDLLTQQGSPFEIVEEEISFSDGSTKAPHHAGVKYRVFKNGLQKLTDIYALPRKQNALDKDFLVYQHRSKSGKDLGITRLTFGDALSHAAAIGHELVHAYGVKKGERVCICSRNFPEYVVALMAATSVGAIAVPMNSWWTTDELKYGLENSGTKVLFCDEERLNRVKPILNDLPTLKGLVTFRCAYEGSLTREDLKVEEYPIMLARGKGKPMPEVVIDKDDVAVIMYTSGTTGHPKGVVLTHRGMSYAIHTLAYTAAFGQVIKKLTAGKGKQSGSEKSQGKNWQNAVMLVVPLFHATGLHAVFLTSFLAARKIVMLYKWDPENALEMIEKERVSHFTGVPTMVMELMNCPNLKKYDTSSLRAIGGGGAPPPPTMVKNIGKTFKKASPTQGYGMTETNAVVCLTGGLAYEAKPKSCGKPVPIIDVQIWDENGNAVPRGTPGNIMLRGPTMMKEYWRNDAATRKTMTRDGWLDTGDIGRLDEDGYLYIMDRAKDMIIRGGENISCADVEAAVYEHPGVQEAAVFGVPHPTLGEEVGVAILPKDSHKGKISLDELKEVCSSLAAFKRPAHLFIWEEQLPRGATGKILKRVIKEKVKTQMTSKL
eukprot:CAMPEP_0184022648 /NCGR_PEP_ID=MMETSP0954-20121128/10754_1 /TAXON_ID=627963 /ORGANISM="Aplanochytrium sp, Strain PBS07" /LENGTH=608 /DNA_ID=CAMNT_0026305109 /DNA_START=60 /DNA_END=1886 /DNA_ORIENTATION=+